jgi:hypothetical protein
MKTITENNTTHSTDDDETVSMERHTSRMGHK